MRIDLNPFRDAIERTSLVKVYGRVSDVLGLLIEGKGLELPAGATCLIDVANQSGASEQVQAEVVGFRSGRILLMPYGDVAGIRPGARITPEIGLPSVDVGQALLGRVIDGLGRPIDGKGPLNCDRLYPLYGRPVNPLKRPRINQPVDIGIRAINGLLTLGKGQRIGIFAGSGVGKSTLLSMIARNTGAEVAVVGLIGERGREVKEFIDRDLGEEGMKRSVVVAATSDQPPLVRMRGAHLATSVAEYFRDQGSDVVLMLDSITRFALAGREVGLAAGEPPTTKGYTPSVFAQLPKILERAGTSDSGGSITGIYSVLVEGDDLNDPVADSMRSILDGHIVLTRQLAEKHQYPAIDVLKSISRLMVDVVDEEQLRMAGLFNEITAVYKTNEDLVNIGAYVKGTNPKLDLAVRMIDSLNGYVAQGLTEQVNLEAARTQLAEVMNQAG